MVKICADTLYRFNLSTSTLARSKFLGPEEDQRASSAIHKIHACTIAFLIRLDR